MAETAIEPCKNLNVKTAVSILSENSELFDIKDIDVNYIPRNGDILAYIYYVKNGTPYHTKFKDLHITVAKRVIEIWKKTQIPTITEKCVKKRIAAVLNKYTSVKRKIRANKFRDNQAQLFLNNIFNITRCSCEIMVQCQCLFKQSLKENQRLFLLDQAMERKFVINEYFCNVDVNQVQSFTSRISDLSIELLTPEPSSSNATAQRNSASLVSDNSEDENRNNVSNYDSDYAPDEKKLIPKKVNIPYSIEKLNINRAVLESMRYNTSFRATAAIINATLEGVGLITDQEKGLVVSKQLFEKRSKKLGSIISKSWITKYRQNDLNCFFFDGVSGYNNMPITRNNKIVADKSTLYDNIVIVQEPGSRYIGFTPTPTSDAETIFQKIIEFFNKNKISLNNLFAIGCDGAATNVGIENGIITKFEKALQRPIHHIVCLLHLLEIILKAIICFYYGENIVKYKIAGQINDKLNNCHNYAIQNFEKIKLNGILQIGKTFDSSQLNSDQKYLYDMGKAVDSGCIDERLAARRPGDIAAGPRWTTLAARFLRLYVSTERPSYKMICVIEFVQNVYIPMMFQIKHYSQWIYGATHIFNMLMFSQRLGKDTFGVVKSRIQFNGFFAHAENILLCMTCDKSKDVRRAAYNTIISIREQIDQQNPQKVRVFRKPQINIQYVNHTTTSNANNNYKHYSNLIDWKQEDIFEPPFTKNLTNEQLKQCIDDEDYIRNMPSIPCHSQKTEFYVQIVKNIVSKYLGQESQDERVKGKIIARELSSINQKKSEYKVLHDATPLDGHHLL